MKGNVVIRKYQESDRDAVIDAWHAASIIATPFLSTGFLEEERKNIRDVWLKKAETWVYEAEGNVVGFLSLVGNEVGGLFVHPECQGKGVGRALMDHAAGMHDELVLDVFEENASGRRFYERYGFRFEKKHLREDIGHWELRLRFNGDA